MVGANRFERSTTRTPSECATRLRYAPIEESLSKTTVVLMQGMFFYCYRQLFPRQNPGQSIAIQLADLT